MKIGPCRNRKIYQQVKILWKRGEIAPEEQPSLFHNIFDISLTSRVQLHTNLLNVVVRIIFSSILKIWYVEVQISRSVSEGSSEFEITRVDCIPPFLHIIMNNVMTNISLDKRNIQVNSYLIYLRNCMLLVLNRREILNTSILSTPMTLTSFRFTWVSYM